MILTTIFLVKAIVSILFVLFLSLLAEYVSPKASGIISGVPTGTAIILFFFAIEQGEEFAAQSSVFNLVGMLSMQVFIFLYYKLSVKNTKWNIILSSSVALIGYLIIIYILKQIPFSLATALIIPIVFIPLFTFLFKKVDNIEITKKEKVKLSPKVLILRAVIASLVILAVTGVAQLVGPKWAGLLSAFPTTLFPLILIIHSTYGARHVHTIIKNVPKGQWAMAIYLVSIFFIYPLMGVYVGTLISYLFVIIYLAILFKIENSK